MDPAATLRPGAAGSPFELLLNADLFAPGHLGRRNLLICAGKVVWVGRARPCLGPEVATEVTDLEGRRVLPGLVDCHVHPTGGGGEAGPASRLPPLAAERFAAAGVTTLVGVLGTDATSRGMADLVTTVYGLRQQGLGAWCYSGGYQLPPATLTGSLRGDILFVEPVLGAGELALSDHRSSQPTVDELLRVASDAHVAGMLAGKAGILHLHLGDGEAGLEPVRRALERSELPPRLFHPTHVNRRRRLFDEALELAERGATVDVTAFPVAEGEDAYPAEVALTRFLDSGLPPERITVSSDAGGSLPVFGDHGRVTGYAAAAPEALAAALARLLAAGQPLDRVLPAFTANPATLLGLAGKGRLDPGADADLVALDGDDRIAGVMAGGRWLWRDPSWATGSPAAAAARSVVPA